MAGRLGDDLVQEILTHLAPDDPVSLVRAAAVCPQWRRVVSTRSFRSGFAQRHRTAPMLGFFANIRDWDEDREVDDDDSDSYDYAARFIRATRFRPDDEDRRDLRALDTRQGRVLLASMPWERDQQASGLEVWDPVLDELQELPDLPHRPTSWNAGVVCADGTCDHLDCRRKHFRVVFLDSGRKKMRVFVYSSESGSWSGPTFGPPSPAEGVEMVPPALVGNALHFLIDATYSILKYDLATGSVSTIDLPRDFISHFATLTTTEDGSLGIARVERSMTEDGGFMVKCALNNWSMETGPEGHVLWSQKRTIVLETLLNIEPYRIRTDYIAFAHGVGVFFVATDVGWFSIDLKSGRAREENHRNDGITYGVVPYTSFYTPEFRQYGVPPPEPNKCMTKQ